MRTLQIPVQFGTEKVSGIFFKQNLLNVRVGALTLQHSEHFLDILVLVPRVVAAPHFLDASRSLAHLFAVAVFRVPLQSKQRKTYLKILQLPVLVPSFIGLYLNQLHL